MSMFNRLLEQLKSRGLAVVPGSEPGQLLLTGPREEKTPEIIAAVKAFKPQLLKKFGRPEPENEIPGGEHVNGEPEPP